MEHLAAALAREAGACMTECFVAIAGAASALPSDAMLAAADGPAELYATLTDALTPVRLFLSSLLDCWCRLLHAHASY